MQLKKNGFFLAKKNNFSEMRFWDRHLTKIGKNQLHAFFEINKSHQSTMASDTCDSKPSQRG